MFLKVALGIMIGGLLGYGYYKVVGCSTGACPITSSPLNSTIYGAFMGFLLSSSF